MWVRWLQNWILLKKPQKQASPATLKTTGFSSPSLWSQTWAGRISEPTLLRLLSLQL